MRAVLSEAVAGDEGPNPIGTADAQIAAICASRRATLATRNTGDFEQAGIKLVKPWHESPP